MRAFIALAVACVTAVMSLNVVAPAASATGYRACSEPLNLSRQTVHRFKNDGDVLPFGKVVVTATKQYPNRYCERLDIGDRLLDYVYRRGDFERRDGRCTSEKFRVVASGPYETMSRKLTLRVPDRACTVQTFSVKWQGKWYSATVKRINP